MLVAEKFAFTMALFIAGCSTGAGGPAKSAASTAQADKPAEIDAKLVAVLAGPQRTEPERARDRYRHARETLEFFGLKEDMNVVRSREGSWGLPFEWRGPSTASSSGTEMF